MRKIIYDISFSTLLFVFSIFALSNIGFIFHLSVNYSYILISFAFCLFYLYKSGNFFKKTSIFFLILFISFVFSNFFIDVSFDGRCYHYTIENLFRLGYNPIYDNLKTFANNNNIFYNLIFVSSYPNAIELIRSNFYLVFGNMESSKTANFLIIFSALFYTIYFLSFKLNKLKTIFLTLAIFSLSVLITQMNTKMVDFSLYCFFIFQIFSLILIDLKKNIKLNYTILIFASILSIATKYTGLLTSSILLSIYFLYKKDLKFLKIISISLLASILLFIQPYMTNIYKFKNPFYPSIGFNKLDYMTVQNPKEFQNKPYLYKFVRSMFSSTSDSRIKNPQTPPIFWKIPFTFHYDMPFIQEEFRISGFGHLFSGIFLISLFLSIYLIFKKKGILAFSIIYLTTLLNPICWWARFVPQFHLLPCFCCYYLRKKNIIFYILVSLIILNGFFVLQENYYGNAYKTKIMHDFYNNLYEKYQTEPLELYINPVSEDEDDTTILFRMYEYGINVDLKDKKTKDMILLHTPATISKNYYLNLNRLAH